MLFLQEVCGNSASSLECSFIVMEDLCSAANPEPDSEPESDMNSASEFEDSDDDCIIRKRWRERLVQLIYLG